MRVISGATTIAQGGYRGAREQLVKLTNGFVIKYGELAKFASELPESVLNKAMAKLSNLFYIEKGQAR